MPPRGATSHPTRHAGPPPHLIVALVVRYHAVFDRCDACGHSPQEVAVVRHNDGAPCAQVLERSDHDDDTKPVRHTKPHPSLPRLALKGLEGFLQHFLGQDVKVVCRLVQHLAWSKGINVGTTYNVKGNRAAPSPSPGSPAGCLL